MTNYGDMNILGPLVHMQSLRYSWMTIQIVASPDRKDIHKFVIMGSHDVYICTRGGGGGEV